MLKLRLLLKEKENVFRKKRRGEGITFLADKVCFRKEPKNLYAFINFWIQNKNEEFEEVDDDEATEQRFYLHQIFKVLFKCLCICMLWGVWGEGSILFMFLKKWICEFVVSRATAINAVEDQIMKVFEYQAKKFFNCILRTLVWTSLRNIAICSDSYFCKVHSL